MPFGNLSRRAFSQIAIGAGTIAITGELGKAADKAADDETPILAVSPPSELIIQHVSATTRAAFDRIVNGVCTNNRFIWDWGDGTRPGVGEFTDHHYTMPGTYNVTLTVESESGQQLKRVTTLLEVPQAKPVPSTVDLLFSVKRQTLLLNLPGKIKSEVLELVQLTEGEIRRADQLANGSVSSQFEAASRYITAAGFITAVYDRLVGEALAGSGMSKHTANRISLENVQSLAFKGVIPVLVSLSFSVGTLSDEVLDAFAPLGRGWFGRRWCDVKFLGIMTAITSVYAGIGLVGCGPLFSIPYIGTTLGTICAAGVVIEYADAVEAANRWRRDCYKA